MSDEKLGFFVFHNQFCLRVQCVAIECESVMSFLIESEILFFFSFSGTWRRI